MSHPQNQGNLALSSQYVSLATMWKRWIWGSDEGGANHSFMGGAGGIPAAPRALLPSPSYLPPYLLAPPPPPHPCKASLPDNSTKMESLSWYWEKRMCFGVRHVSSSPAPAPMSCVVLGKLQNPSDRQSSVCKMNLIG